MDGSIKYTVQLSSETRQRLDSITRNGSSAAKKILRARVLLMSDAHHELGRYPDQQIASALGVHPNTVARIRKRFLQQGEQSAISRKIRLTPPVPPKVDGHVEAQLVAICCSPPPQGRVRWTLHLLQQEAVSRKILTSISRETIRTTLKKTRFSLGASSGSAFPNATPPASSRRWKRCSISTPARSISTSR